VRWHKTRQDNLNLVSNSIGAEGAGRIGEGVQCLASLTSFKLNLGGNSIGDEGAGRIAEGVQCLPALTSFNLNC